MLVFSAELTSGLVTIVSLYQDGTAEFNQGDETYPGWYTEFPNNAVRVEDSDGYTFVF